MYPQYITVEPQNPKGKENLKSSQVQMSDHLQNNAH